VTPYLVWSPLLHREAILSSRIEGTITTPEQLVLLEAASKAGQPKRSHSTDTQEVLNYIKAMYFGLNRLKELPVCLRLMREIHAQLLTGVRGERERPGDFRNVQNWIGVHQDDPIERARFVPPPVAEMQAALSDFEVYLNANLDMPLLVKLALVHYQFETIHPFRDGNGRIGRLIIPLLLCSHKQLQDPLLYLSSFFEAHNDAYVRLLLRVSQTGDWLSWVKFFLQAVVECSIEAAELVEGLLRLRAGWHERFQAARNSALLLKLIDHLFKEPAISIPEARQLLGVTYTAAWWSVKKLMEGKILVQVGDDKKNRLFFAPEIMNFMRDVRRVPAAAGQVS
jgi:Fic family protein